MSIAVAIYADHQETIQYPVGYIASQLDWADEVWLFGGDEISTHLLEITVPQHLRWPSRPLVAHNIRHKVSLPEDIAIARNKTQLHLREHSTCDWFVILSADTLPTSAAVETIRYLIDLRIDAPRHIPTHMLELYCDVGSSPYGCTIFHRDYANDWTGDGSYFLGSAGGEDTKIPTCLHLGYLSTDAVGRHLAQHARTWNSPEGARRFDLYQNDRREFVRQTLLDIRERRVTAGAQPQKYISRLIFVDEPEFWLPARFEGVPGHDLCHRDNAEYLSREYAKAIDALGLRDDLEFVRSIANEIGRDWSQK